jgi:hypothetical protein
MLKLSGCQKKILEYMNSLPSLGSFNEHEISWAEWLVQGIMKFEMHLQGLHCHTWSNEAACQAQTIVMFDKTVVAFQGQLWEDEDYKKQLDLIQELWNPRNMKQGNFLLCTYVLIKQYGPRTVRHSECLLRTQWYTVV